MFEAEHPKAEAPTKTTFLNLLNVQEAPLFFLYENFPWAT